MRTSGSVPFTPRGLIAGALRPVENEPRVPVAWSAPMTSLRSVSRFGRSLAAESLPHESSLATLPGRRLQPLRAGFDLRAVLRRGCRVARSGPDELCRRVPGQALLAVGRRLAG